MTAWAALLLKSTLPAGTAWEHLNSPGAGPGVVVNDGIAVEVDVMPIEIEVRGGDVEVEVLDVPIEVEVEIDPVSLEVCE